MTKGRGDLGSFFDAYADRWDAAYAHGDPRTFDYANRKEHLLELTDALTGCPSRVLELGCGAGHTAVELAKRGHRVTALDVSPKMVEAARANASRAGVDVDVHVGTVRELPSNLVGFDLVVAAGVMDYVEDRVETLSEIRARLAVGGACALSYTNLRSPIYWLEVPPKRALALGAWAVTRHHRWKDIAFPASRADRPRAVVGELEAAGLAFERMHFYTYGLRMGPLWWPPLGVVKQLERVLGDSPLASLGRGFFAVGRRTS
jgi:SAM-dependent methyltransferase